MEQERPRQQNLQWNLLHLSAVLILKNNIKKNKIFKAKKIRASRSKTWFYSVTQFWKPLEMQKQSGTIIQVVSANMFGYGSINKAGKSQGLVSLNIY